VLASAFSSNMRGLPYQRLSSAALDPEKDSGILATDSGMMLATHSGISGKVANIASEQMANFTSEWVANFDWNRRPTCPGIRTCLRVPDPAISAAGSTILGIDRGL
jgi:hypothetical protein